MVRVTRRHFMGAAVAGVAAASMHPQIRGQVAGLEFPPETPGTPTGPFDSLFLTWQRDPTTTMTIQWAADDSETIPEIRFAELNSSDWKPAQTIKKPFEQSELKVFRCELTGLSAGSEYKFQIGLNTPEYRFRTMPAKATDTITFVSGGDAGIDQHAVNSNVLAAKQEPYFVLMAGDLAYDNGRSPDTFLKFIQNYSRTMVDRAGRLVPMLACPGNHEVNGGYRAQRADAPSYLSLFDGFFPELSYGVLDVGDYLSLVLLDTDHLSPIAGEQTDWLERTLRDRQDRPHLIVANHVPCYPSYRAPEGSNNRPGTGEEQRKHWCPLFEKYRVDVVLEHHDHTFKRTHPLTDGRHDRNGVLYLGDGSWGKLRIPKTPEQRPYLAKVSQSYHITTHKLEDDSRFHLAMDESGRIADVTMTSNKRTHRRVGG